MTGPPTPDELTRIAEAVVADGFAAHAAPVAVIVAAARRYGIRPVLIDIVADPTSPRPPRERALGRLIVALSTLSTLSTLAGSPADTVTTGAASAA